MLERCGFGMKWCTWIYHCISTVRLSVLVNGIPKGFFTIPRELRQGDPLSMLLLVFMMEDFSKMIPGVVEGGFIFAFSVGEANTSLLNTSHLSFTDDISIFCGANPDQIWALRALYYALKLSQS